MNDKNIDSQSKSTNFKEFKHLKLQTTSLQRTLMKMEHYRALVWTLIISVTVIFIVIVLGVKRTYTAYIFLKTIYI